MVIFLVGLNNNISGLLGTKPRVGGSLRLVTGNGF